MGRCFVGVSAVVLTILGTLANAYLGLSPLFIWPSFFVLGLLYFASLEIGSLKAHVVLENVAHKDREGFFKRNKDKLLVPLLIGVVAYLLGLLTRLWDKIFFGP